jgi:hypothetical protein
MKANCSKPLTLVISTLFSVLLCLCLLHSPAGAVGWNIFYVDECESFNSVASSPAGGTGVAYYSGGKLKYASALNNWQPEIVDAGHHSDSGTGLYCSLAYDQYGLPGISYMEYDYILSTSLKYAHFNGVSWDTVTVDGDPAYYHNVGSNTSLAYDPTTGLPAIAYHDNENDVLLYVEHNGYGWQDPHWWDADPGAGQGNALAFNSFGAPWIAYYVGIPENELRLNETWISGNGQYPDLMIDESNHQVLSYQSSGVKYSRWTGSYWDTQDVDDVGSHTSIASTRFGDGISYYHGGEKQIRYAHNIGGSNWDIEELYDGIGSWGGHTSLASDAWGFPVISFNTGSPDHGLWIAWQWGFVPVPELLGNGQSDILIISEYEPIVLTVEMDSGDFLGDEVDWWLFAESDFGTFYYTVNGRWTKSDTPIPAYQGRLRNLPEFTIGEYTLPVGMYQLTFAVDDDMDGRLFMDDTWADWLFVEVY